MICNIFLDIDECVSIFCMYGNDCIQDRINSYICVCSERFEGVYCERGWFYDVLFEIEIEFYLVKCIDYY